MAGTGVLVERRCVAVDFPENEDVRIFPAATDVERNDAFLFPRCVAQLAQECLRSAGIGGFEPVTNDLNDRLGPRDWVLHVLAFLFVETPVPSIAF